MSVYKAKNSGSFIYAEDLASYPTFLQAINLVLGCIAEDAHSWHFYQEFRRQLSYSESVEIEELELWASDPSCVAKCALSSCALVCRDWLAISRRHTFSKYKMTVSDLAYLSYLAESTPGGTIKLSLPANKNQERTIFDLLLAMNAGPTGHIERPLSLPTLRFLTKTTFSGHFHRLLLTINSDDISAATSAFGPHDGPNKRFRQSAVQILRQICSLFSNSNVKDVSLQVAGCDISGNFLDVLTNRGVGFSNNLTSLSLVDEVEIGCSTLDLARYLSRNSLPNLVRLRMAEAGCSKAHEATDQLKANSYRLDYEMHLEVLNLRDHYDYHLTLGWMSDECIMGGISVENLRIAVNPHMTPTWRDIYSLISRTNTRLMFLSLGTTQLPALANFCSTTYFPRLETLKLKLRNREASREAPKVEGIPFFDLKDSEQDFADLLSVIKRSGCMPALRTIELKIWDYYQWIYFPKPDMEAWSLNPYSVGPLPVFRADPADTTSANNGDWPTEQEWIEMADPCWTDSIHEGKGLVDWKFLDESLETLMPAGLPASAMDITDAHSDMLHATPGLQKFVFAVSPRKGILELSREQELVIIKFLKQRLPRCSARGLVIECKDYNYARWKTFGEP